MDYQSVEERLIRVETLLYKLAAHLGMNPTDGTQLRDDVPGLGEAKKHG